MGSRELSALIAVYNNTEAIELTLKSLILAGSNYLSEIVLVNSSDNDSCNDFLSRFSESNPLIRVIPHIGLGASPGARHANALRAGVDHLRGSYVLVSDSDVEYLSGRDFPNVIKEFDENEDVFMIGRYVGGFSTWAPRLDPSCLFLRTMVLKSYIAKGIDFSPGPKCHAEDGTIIGTSDTAGYLFFQSCASGPYRYIDISPDVDHFGAMSREQNMLSQTNNAVVIQKQYENKRSRIKQRLSVVRERFLES